MGLPWVTDGLILLALGIMSIAIYGMFWLPDVFMRLHAASKIGVLGVIPILLATLTTGEPALICRSLLIIVFLLLTIPVSSHAIARAAMQSGDGADWSA
jgi:multicomponent Na+:H+ antiporter subunit G